MDELQSGEIVYQKSKWNWLHVRYFTQQLPEKQPYLCIHYCCYELSLSADSRKNAFETLFQNDALLTPRNQRP
jgi:hypothetical protein